MPASDVCLKAAELHPAPAVLLEPLADGFRIEHGIPTGHGHAQGARNGCGIACRRDQTHSQQRLVRGNAATGSLGAGQVQRARIDNAADKKVVIVFSRPLLRDKDRRYDGRRCGRSPWPRLARTTRTPHGNPMPLCPTKVAHK
jgi:hypothetical protein